MRNHDAEFAVSPTSPEQSPPGSATQSDNVAAGTLLDSFSTLSKATGISMAQYDAHLAVMGELLASILAHLPASMQADVAGTFRDRIEDLMSLSDDISPPKHYHSALLTEVNRYLNALR
ncbi:hypothetical protein [Paraburkholderia nemoris]|uniref:hypothetical protein n=1 Tax=Paraburkholderia nemoris TaxID=2793076 RepID=UPI001B8AAA08|nr:hypothetical protein [Paraburkholderia nemoris]